MIKKITFAFLLFAFINVAFSQKKMTWTWFSEHIKFENMFFEDAGIWMLGPKFDDAIQDLEGKEVFISGYIMPIDEEFNYYAISANSFARCFFCGGAGPETVMSLEFRDKTLTFETDDFRTVKGRLRLNIYNIDEPFLILEDVQFYQE